MLLAWRFGAKRIVLLAHWADLNPKKACIIISLRTRVKFLIVISYSVAIHSSSFAKYLKTHCKLTFRCTLNEKSFSVSGFSRAVSHKLCAANRSLVCSEDFQTFLNCYKNFFKTWWLKKGHEKNDWKLSMPQSKKGLRDTALEKLLKKLLKTN